MTKLTVATSLPCLTITNLQLELDWPVTFVSQYTSVQPVQLYSLCRVVHVAIAGYKAKSSLHQVNVFRHEDVQGYPFLPLNSHLSYSYLYDEGVETLQPQ